MLGKDIEAALQVYAQHHVFLGTYQNGARPEIPIGCYAIFNTRKESSEHELQSKSNIIAHWIVIGRPEATLYEVFDSQPRQTNEIFYFFDNLSGNIIDLMPEACGLCGEFAIFFLVVRLSNMDLDFTTVLNLYFSVNKEDNKSKVLQLLHHLKAESPSL